MSHPDEVIDQAAKALGKLHIDEPWPAFVTPEIIERHMMWATRLADAGLLADPELKAEVERLSALSEATQRHLGMLEAECNTNTATIIDSFGILRDAGVPLGGELLPNRVGALAEHVKVALWLHAELKWMYSNAVGKSIPLDMVRADYCSPDEVAELQAPIEAERDKLAWLHAEAVFFGHGWCSQWLATRDTVHKQQGRIDAALKACDAMVSMRNWTPAGLGDVRAALNGDAPSKPATALERGADAPSPVAKNAEAWCDEHGHPAARCSYCATDDGAIDETGGAA